MSVSSIVFSSIFFNATLLIPGSPLNGYSFPSTFAVKESLVGSLMAKPSVATL
jgi:hypothetical protein